LDIYYPKSSRLKWDKIKKYVKSAYKQNVQHVVDLDNTTEDFQFKRLSSLRRAQTLHSVIRTQNGLQDFRSKSPGADIDDMKHDNKVLQQPKNHRHSSAPIASNNAIQIKRRFSKFGLRSNSVLRNDVVVAHGEKHNKVSNQSISDIPGSVESTKSIIRMTPITTETIQRHTTHDSECSLSTSSCSDSKHGKKKPKDRNKGLSLSKIKKKK